MLIVFCVVNGDISILHGKKEEILWLLFILFAEKETITNAASPSSSSTPSPMYCWTDRSILCFLAFLATSFVSSSQDRQNNVMEDEEVIRGKLRWCTPGEEKLVHSLQKIFQAIERKEIVPVLTEDHPLHLPSTEGRGRSDSGFYSNNRIRAEEQEELSESEMIYIGTLRTEGPTEITNISLPATDPHGASTSHPSPHTLPAPLLTMFSSSSSHNTTTAMRRYQVTYETILRASRGAASTSTNALWRATAELIGQADASLLQQAFRPMFFDLIHHPLGVSS